MCIPKVCDFPKPYLDLGNFLSAIYVNLISMRIALVHDFLKQFGGAERVVLNFKEIWPDAPLYTLFTDLKDPKIGPFKFLFEGWEIHNTFFNKYPLKPLISPLRFLIPMAWESFNFSDYDVVLSSAGWGMAYSVLTKPETLHICYCHTPPRNLYGMASRMIYYKRNKLKGAAASLYGNIVNPFMRMMDFSCAQRPDFFIANSQNVRKRIQKFYNRDAKVIYPPVEINKQKSGKSVKQKGDYYLVVNRLEPEKMIDLAVLGCKELGLKLKVIGTGTDHEKLKKIGQNPNIEFLGKVSDQKLRKLYLESKAFLLNEKDVDFGIVSLEAQAFGKPVLALRSGGYLETVIEGKTGEFYKEPTLESFIKALKNFRPEKYNPADCIKNAKRFSKDRFMKEIKEFVEEKYSKHTNKTNGDE